MWHGCFDMAFCGDSDLCRIDSGEAARKAKVVEAELRERIGDLEYRLFQAEKLLGL